jgi:hypothetical protein
MNLTDSLDALLAEHDRIGSRLRDDLVAGLPREQVDATIRELGLTPPTELLDFFAWHDIRKESRTKPGIDWFWPVDAYRLPEATDYYRKALQIGGVTPAELEETSLVGKNPAATDTGYWRTDWFPVLGGVEQYAVVCGLDGNRTASGPVWRVNWHPDSDFQTRQVAASLTEFIDRAVAVFRAGGYEWSEQYRSVIANDDVFGELGLDQSRPWP